MIRKAKAVWRGTGRDGNGDLSTDSGVLAKTPYSFRTRFENEKGTNPEELIAAAHAGCFTMALAFQLQSAGLSLLLSSVPRRPSVSTRMERASASVARLSLCVLACRTWTRRPSNAWPGTPEQNCPVSESPQGGNFTGCQVGPSRGASMI